MRRQRLLKIVVLLVAAVLVTLGVVVATVRYTPRSQHAERSVGARGAAPPVALQLAWAALPAGGTRPSHP